YCNQTQGLTCQRVLPEGQGDGKDGKDGKGSLDHKTAGSSITQEEAKWKHLHPDILLKQPPPPFCQYRHPNSIPASQQQQSQHIRRGSTCSSPDSTATNPDLASRHRPGVGHGRRSLPTF